MIKILISLLIFTIFTHAQSQYTLILSKQKLYIGEAITATLKLEHDNAEKITKISFQTLKLDGYRVLPIADDSTPAEHRYIIIPQISGKQTIPSQKIEIAHKNPSTYRNVWQTLHTNPKHITILPLPANIHHAGNYTIQSHIDHNSTQADKPINLTITIRGKGSLKSMQKFKLHIDNALVFASEPIIKTQITDTGYHSIFTQKFSIIADSDFTITPIMWQYLNTDTKLTETLATPIYQIRVNNPLHKNTLYRYIALLFIGILTGAILTILILKIKNHTKSHPSNISKRILKTKNNKDLYKLLLPYANDPDIAEILSRLDENIHRGTEHRINRNMLIRYFYKNNP